ncbi:MAG: NnrS family protein [Caulobacteraceae bacterium]|nr:NnrS family protein [Caulobacteraceae bacterium]
MFWLAMGLLLGGLAILAPCVNGGSSPAFTPSPPGAFGVMTLAVMTRASLGHTGQKLAATPHISAIYILVNLAALVRVTAPFLPEHYTVLLALSAALWRRFGWFVCLSPAFAADRAKRRSVSSRNLRWSDYDLIIVESRTRGPDRAARLAGAPLRIAY